MGAKHITQKEFDLIKLLQENKVKSYQMAQITGRGRNIIQQIKASDTLEDYIRKSRERNAKYKATQEPKNWESVIPQTTDTGNEEIVLILNNINDELREIKEQLKWLGDNIEVPEKSAFSKIFNH